MVLGANDGIISTACLILGVAASDASRAAILTAGLAGLTAGAASMALGEYVSVSSQLDSERADIAREVWEIEHVPERERAELAAIYEAKGLSPALAAEVAAELSKGDPLAVGDRNAWWGYLLMAMVLTVAAAVISYRVIEKPTIAYLRGHLPARLRRAPAA